MLTVYERSCLYIIKLRGEPPILNLSHELFDRYYESWWGILAAYDRIAASHGVTQNVMLVVTLLYKHRAPMTQTELGKDLHLSRQTVTSVVDSLERSGYVQRGTAEGDRRVRIVALTDTGRAFARQLGRAMRQTELRAFELFSNEELRALIDGMEKLWQGISHVLEEPLH